MNHNISNTNIKLILEHYFKNKNVITLKDLYDVYQPTTGFLYCLYNEIFKFYGDNLYKCGNSIDTDKRLNQYTTSYPMPSTILLTSDSFFDKSFAETLLFYYLKDFKFKPNREFIDCHLNIIKDAFDKVKQFFSIYNTKQLLINYLLIDNNFKKFFVKYNYADKKIIINNIDCVNDNDIVEYINSTHKNINDDKFKFICDLSKQLNITDVLMYKNIFTNKIFRRHYFYFIDLITNNFNNEKIKIIHKLYLSHKIKYLSLDKFHLIDKINIDGEEYNNIITIFRSEKPKPIDNLKLKHFVISLFKNLFGKLNIFNKKIKRNPDDGKKSSIYFWNIDKINFFIDLHKKNKPEFSCNDLFNN
jgi:hypothetical protein